MKLEPCAGFADRLVEFADGELSQDEAGAVHRHLQACPDCRATVEALRQSLDLARAVWSEPETEPAERPSSASRRIHRRSWQRPAAIAAGLLLAVSLPTAWHYGQTRPGPSPAPSTGRLTLEQIESITARAGVSARLLGAADYLAESGGEELARQRFTYLVEAYPETDVAALAQSRLKAMRSIQ